MVKKSKARAVKRSTRSAAERHTAAIGRYASALQKHAAALSDATAAHSSIAAALRNNTAAVAATKPRKTLNEKTADAVDCMSQWLIQAKGVSRPDSTNPVKNMAADFHIGSPQEMQLCLEAVQVCMATKGDFYHLDTTSSQANQHMNTLVTSSLGTVVADIVRNTA
jgi:hypothetical protein